MTFEGHFGDILSNFLLPHNIFGADEATHLKFSRQNDRLWQVLACGYYFSAQAYAQLRAVCQRQPNYLCTLF